MLLEALNNLALVIGGLILIGGAIVLVRGAFNKAALQALDEDNDRLRKRITDIEEENRSLEQKDQLKEEAISGLNKQVALLTAMVTQRANVEAVMETLQEHHESAMRGQQRILDILNAREQ